MDINKIIEKSYSDSKKTSCNAQAELTELAINHHNKLININSKYDKEYQKYSQYQIGKGSYYFENIDDKFIYVKYTDHWQYGGHCEETILIPLLDLISFDYLKYEINIKNESIIQIQNDINSNKSKIKLLKLKLEKLSQLPLEDQ
jgi:hypothetical protein